LTALEDIKRSIIQEVYDDYSDEKLPSAIWNELVLILHNDVIIQDLLDKDKRIHSPQEWADVLNREVKKKVFSASIQKLTTRNDTAKRESALPLLSQFNLKVLSLLPPSLA